MQQKGTGMDIFKAGGRPSKLAAAEYFTGTVWQTPIVEAPAPARVRALKVAFAPGARTAWHKHPLGQTLYVTDGVGLVGWGDAPVQRIAAGDTVWIPPGCLHWHGAAPDSPMTHIAIQEALDGQVADWGAHVSDAEYLGAAVTEA
jgi:quercetin dioxygenase-like cupin family protein